ncbi:MAG TPA: alpha/beta family hydrolase [Gemmatimonadaceae bacterium]|nr:alpha/beta family hydrolase [Gemmatimonadaceae bacterium]
MTIEWKIDVGDEQTSAMYEPPTSGGDVALFVCAHGAGGNMLDRGMTTTANILRANGLGVVRFNFLYKEKKSGRPDPMPKLIATTRAVIAHAQSELVPSRLVIGGRSMGGRAASMLAAEGFDASGLLLLAYPLHPAGQPEKLRDAHLGAIRMSVLCFNGTRDALCTRELMERALTTVKAPWDMQWIDGADHMFHVLKSSGRTDAEVMAQIGRTAGEWSATL